MDFAALRRWPDVEAANLEAMDAADRLILDEARSALAEVGEGRLVVVGDDYGALTLAAADAGIRGIRVHQDPLNGERALARNARTLGLEEGHSSLPFDPALVAGATLVLLRLPRSLDALDDVAALIAAHADPGVVVYAGGRIKHMTLAMNEVLLRHFERLDVTHARQKSRVLVARGPRPEAPGAANGPRCERHDDLGLIVCAYGGAFAGTSVDIGTRFLLGHLPAEVPARVVDLACGTGVIGSRLALRHPEIEVYACDQSAAAVASARATAEANGIADRVTVARDDGLGLLPDAGERLIVLNPPFHVGAAVHTGAAERLFADAGRVLAPGGELWAVWNSPLGYRPALERHVGRTRQIARNAKFTVTASTRA